MTTSKQAEQLDRLRTLLQDRDLIRRKADTSTMQSRTIAEQDDVRGRWEQQNKSIVTGAARVPQYTAASLHHADPVGIEPPIDATDCGDRLGYALGESHEQPHEVIPVTSSRQQQRESDLGVAAAEFGDPATGEPLPSRSDAEGAMGSEVDSSRLAAQPHSPTIRRKR